jgi:hypothetical protein
MEPPLDEDSRQATDTSARGIVSQWLSRVGAVLILAGIIGVAFALFSNHSAPSAGLAGTPVTRMVQADGLTFTMQVTPGPYFLGELLEADLTLSNESLSTYSLGGLLVAGPCGDAVYLNMVGGSKPQYVLPVADSHSCPFLMSTLKPGESATLHQFMPLSSSGDVTLESGADFLQTVTGPDGSQTVTSGHSPLDGLWPSLHLSVAATAPLDRQITLQREGTLVQINAPLAALAHLYYIYNVTCNGTQGDIVGTGNYAWQPIFTDVLHKPTCGDYGDQTTEWSYAVSAPGYAIASGKVGS